MKNLSKFELSTQEAEEIKGGLRYTTRSPISYMHKRMELTMQGKPHNTDIHNGEYCIEW